MSVIAVEPVRIPREVYSFVIKGKPWVQKNNLFIYYKNPSRKIGAFIGHSGAMSKVREAISIQLFSEYRQ